MIRLSKVKGHSMSPPYLDGDYVLSLTPKLFRLQKGDVVIIRHPAYGYLIKEICRKVKKGYYVQGTHPESTGSQAIGLVLPEMIKGKVIA